MPLLSKEKRGYNLSRKQTCGSKRITRILFLSKGFQITLKMSKKDSGDGKMIPEYVIFNSHIVMVSINEQIQTTIDEG